jgi:hypothetical protein
MSLKALIAFKTRNRIAALVRAAAVAPFVLAGPAQAVNISFNDVVEGTVQLLVDGRPRPDLIDPGASFGEFIQTLGFKSTDPLALAGRAGIRFVEPGTDITSDVLQLTITAVDNPPNTVITNFAFGSDPNLISDTAGFTVIDESIFSQGFVEVGTRDIPFKSLMGILSLPNDISVFVQSDIEPIPGPVVGDGAAGLLLLACGSLFVLRRRRRQYA